MTVGQPSFADLAMARRRPSELDRIAALIQWAPIEDRLRKLVERQGRPPFPPLLMLRALLLGQWHTLSDRDLEAALDDRASFRRVDRRHRGTPIGSGVPRSDRQITWCPARDPDANWGSRTTPIHSHDLVGMHAGEQKPGLHQRPAQRPLEPAGRPASSRPVLVMSVSL